MLAFSCGWWPPGLVLPTLPIKIHQVDPRVWEHSMSSRDRRTRLNAGSGSGEDKDTGSVGPWALCWGHKTSALDSAFGGLTERSPCGQGEMSFQRLFFPF